MAPRFGLLLIGALIAGTAASADEFADFTAAVAGFSAHNRAALRYLHNDDVGPMSEEIGEMRAAWAVINGKFGAPPPRLDADRTLYTTILVDVSMRLVGVSMFIQMGSRSGVRNSLTAIRADLSALRKANGVTTLADCVLEANLTTLVAHGDPVPDDWSNPNAGSSLSTKVAQYGHILDRCNSIADADTRSEPRFRQLIDKIKATLAALANALAAHDTVRLRAILKQWQSDDDEFAFRYG